MDYYINANGKKLKCGYTTGTSATLATKASAIILLTGEKVSKCSVLTPKGIEVCVDILNIEAHKDFAISAVKKDGGDDVDATHKALIYSKVSLCDEGIFIDGGIGVGRVTKKGLDQPVGNAAINSTPRKMICKALDEVSAKYGYKGGFKVEIFVPSGEEIAKKTFNENLGIIGGISILGTSGIVEPQSVKALVDSIEVELKMLKANGISKIIISPGNYSDNFMKNNQILQEISNVKCSNFIGDTLDLANSIGFEEILLVGHVGKFCKLSAGIFNTHSKVADGRTHIFTSYSALCGAKKETLVQIMESKTTDACIEILKEQNLCEKVMEEIINSAQNHIERRSLAKIGIVMFSNVYGLLGKSKKAQEIIENWSEK